MQNEGRRETVGAVVVTYNRKALLGECLDALLSQTRRLDSIIVVDNASTDGTSEFLEERYLRNGLIDYVRLPENTGGAGGFYEGVKRGHDQGFEWLWLMDDDGKPAKDCLELLLDAARRHGIYAINPLVLNLDDPMRLAHGFRAAGDGRFHVFARELEKHDQLIETRNPFEGFVLTFNAFLLNRVVVRTVGYPIKEFFIWGDDTEYLCRITRTYSVATYVPAKFYHPATKLTHQRVLFGWCGSALICKDWLFYCHYRNVFLIKKRYQGAGAAFQYALTNSLKYLLFSLQKRDFRYVGLTALAFFHASRGKFGYERAILRSGR